MEYSIWYHEQIAHLESIIEPYSKSELSKFKTNWLRKLIGKVDEFIETCPTCSELKTIIEDLILELEVLLKDSSKSKDHYNTQVSSLYTHLKTAHHIVTERHYMHIGVIIGVVLGLAITFIFKDQSATIEKYGLWIGAVPGFLIGTLLDKKADSEGKVIN